METITETELSPDISYTKTEVFDVEFARQLLDNKDIPKEDRDKLRRYVKGAERGNKHVTTYKLGKNCKNDFLGRLIALKGESLQCLPKEIRNAIARNYYHDVDMVNAQPTILLQYCEKQGWKCDAIKKYVEQREELLNELCETLNIQRWEAKERIISLFFGSCNANDLTSFFSNELLPELRRIMENNYKVNFSELKWLDKQPNRVGKALAYMLQTEERKCLLAMDRSLGKYGRSLDVYIHDGGLVLKKDSEEILSTELFRKIESDVEKETGYKIHLLVKPMKSSFEKLNEIEDDYEEIKQEFEKTHFKLMNPPCYVRIHEGSIQYIKSADLKLMYENKYYQIDKKFIERWVTDKMIRTYEKVVFKPKQEVSENVFNIFTDFSCEAVKGDISVMNELMMLLSGNDKDVFEYLENYFAHLIQKPFEKPGKCLVFYTARQGAGKDTPLDFIGKIIGNDYFFNTEDAENQVFGRFTSHLQKTLLLKMEEVEFETNKKNESQLLSLITASTRSYEAKGRDAITLDDYKRIVMTTNKSVPVNIAESDRRYVLINSSEEKVGDREFWNNAYKELAKPELRKAYHYHLLTKDISNFEIRDSPKTELYNEIKTTLRPYHAKFFQEQIETNPDNTTFNWRAWDLLNEMKASVRFELNPSRFGKDMKTYNDIVTKEHTRTGKIYTFEPETMKSFLIQKGWWIDI